MGFNDVSGNRNEMNSPLPEDRLAPTSLDSALIQQLIQTQHFINEDGMDLVKCDSNTEM